MCLQQYINTKVVKQQKVLQQIDLEQISTYSNKNHKWLLKKFVVFALFEKAQKTSFRTKLEKLEATIQQTLQRMLCDFATKVIRICYNLEARKQQHKTRKNHKLVAKRHTKSCSILCVLTQ